MTTAELIRQGEVIFDLRNKLRAAEAENTELKKVLKAQCVAAINDRIAALEEAAREVVQAYARAREDGRWPPLWVYLKRLAEVLEGN